MVVWVGFRLERLLFGAAFSVLSSGFPVLYHMEASGLPPSYYGVCQNKEGSSSLLFKKNLNACKPSEHPPQVEECLKVWVGTLAVETKPLHGTKRVPQCNYIGLTV